MNDAIIVVIGIVCMILMQLPDTKQQEEKQTP
jgi:preprotein translocase subunit YajC